MSRPNPQLEVWKETAFGTYNHWLRHVSEVPSTLGLVQATGLEIRIQLLAVWIIPLRRPKKTLELSVLWKAPCFVDGRVACCHVNSVQLSPAWSTSMQVTNVRHQHNIGCWEAEFLTSALVPWGSLVCREGTALGRIKLGKSILEIEDPWQDSFPRTFGYHKYNIERKCSQELFSEDAPTKREYGLQPKRNKFLKKLGVLQ